MKYVTMHHYLLKPLAAAALALFSASVAQAQTAPARLGADFRESKAGWIYLHLEGSPHDIGYAYGCLLAPEIDDAQKALQTMLKTEHHRDWAFFRDAARRMFWPKLDGEYQQELTAIAEGLTARGYHYDATDILAENGYIDLADYYLPTLRSASARASGAPFACSAFVATGAYTTDGKIVMGQNFWWDYLTGERFRVLLDVTPQHGHRFLLDTLPGFIHSGTDFAINAAGILVTETTIGGFMDFDPAGVPEFERMRKAVQYSDNLDDFVRIMKTGNNGGYANTWLLGDTKTNEIGKLELGLKVVTFTHTKDGCYFGANFPENPKLIAEECVPGAGQDLSCVGRKLRWTTLLTENKGKIDADKARQFLADTYDQLHKRAGADNCTLCGRGDTGAFPSPGGAVNAKVTTADLARTLSLWARMDFPNGDSFSSTAFLEKAPGCKWMAPYLRDMPAEPWTEFTAKRNLHSTRSFPIADASK